MRSPHPTGEPWPHGALALAVALLAAGPAAAAPGDVLATIPLSVYGNGVAVNCDGDIYLSHGDTRHPILLPGTVQECYEFARDAFDFADGAPPADELVARGEARKLVQIGLAALDLDRRAVFLMHDLDGHSMPEIAAVLHVPLNTLYSRLRLAREQFAVAVREQTRRGTR